ncbi:MAG: AAA family ATPase [Gammaproteobacteria bacterium]|nr:AAA family ATPase [Gammaproteobacteria bacterium]NNJ83800.1 AAA family ATPase [Gammaproteobacteria bacterium]
MKIDHLVLGKVGCFDHLEMTFPAGRDPNKADIHLIVGPNGSGKSTILMALAQFFSMPSTGLYERCHGRDSFALLRLDDDLEAGFALHRPGEPNWPGEPNSSTPWDYSPSKPSRPLIFSGGSEELAFYQIQDKSFILDLSHYRNLTQSFKPFSPKYKDTHFSHLAFAYGGQRSVENFRLKGIVEQEDAPLMYACLSPKPANRNETQPLVQWVANTSAKAAFASERQDESSHRRYRDVIGRMEQIISGITGRKFAFVLSYDPINVNVSLDGEELPIDVLPDGLKSLISWIGDLLMRMDRVPWIDDTPLLEREFTLFLDEIEVHLHPAWQRKILPVVQNLFPSAQVFVSTHSPFVIASADDAWIHPLHLDEKGRGQVGEPLPSMVGNSYATVLRDVLGVEAEFAPQVDEALKEFYALRDKALRGEPGALDQLRTKGNALQGFGEEVLAIVRPEISQVERRLRRHVMEGVE